MNNSAKVAVLFSIVLLTGCTGAGSILPSSADQPIKIESEPAGADVYVMGEMIGATPLQITREEVFPRNYPKGRESLYGRVVIRKDGCADFSSTISTEVGRKGLHAKLDCTDKTPASSREMPTAGETVERRLQKIKDLLNKGLITEDEARQTRERILNEL